MARGTSNAGPLTPTASQAPRGSGRRRARRAARPRSLRAAPRGVERSHYPLFEFGRCAGRERNRLRVVSARGDLAARGRRAGGSERRVKWPGWPVAPADIHSRGTRRAGRSRRGRHRPHTRPRPPREPATSLGHTLAGSPQAYAPRQRHRRPDDRHGGRRGARRSRAAARPRRSRPPRSGTRAGTSPGMSPRTSPSQVRACVRPACNGGGERRALRRGGRRGAALPNADDRRGRAGREARRRPPTHYRPPDHPHATEPNPDQPASHPPTADPTPATEQPPANLTPPTYARPPYRLAAHTLSCVGRAVHGLRLSRRPSRSCVGAHRHQGASPGGDGRRRRQRVPRWRRCGDARATRRRRLPRRGVRPSTSTLVAGLGPQRRGGGASQTSSCAPTAGPSAARAPSARPARAAAAARCARGPSGRGCPPWPTASPTASSARASDRRGHYASHSEHPAAAARSRLESRRSRTRHQSGGKRSGAPHSSTVKATLAERPAICHSATYRPGGAGH